MLMMVDQDHALRTMGVKEKSLNTKVKELVFTLFFFLGEKFQLLL